MINIASVIWWKFDVIEWFIQNDWKFKILCELVWRFAKGKKVIYHFPIEKFILKWQILNFRSLYFVFVLDRCHLKMLFHNSFHCLYARQEEKVAIVSCCLERKWNEPNGEKRKWNERKLTYGKGIFHGERIWSQGKIFQKRKNYFTLSWNSASSPIA